MAVFEPKNPGYRAAAAAMFDGQPAMRTLGIVIVRLAPGEVELAMPHSPAFQHGAKQRGAIGEAAVEAALGDAEVLGEHLDPHALDPRAGEFAKPCLDPDVALAIAHEENLTGS